MSIRRRTPPWRGLFGSLGFFAYMVFQEGGGAFGRLARMDRYGYLYSFIGMVATQTSSPFLCHTSVAHVAVIYAAGRLSLADCVLAFHVAKTPMQYRSDFEAD